MSKSSARAKSGNKGADAKPATAASSVSTSNGVTAPIRPTLMDYINGTAVPTGIKFRNGDLVTRLWAVLIQPNRDLASKRMTGGDAAIVLCSQSYGSIIVGEETYAPGSDPSTLPHPDMLKINNARFFLADGYEIPTPKEFVQLVEDLRRKHSASAE